MNSRFIRTVCNLSEIEMACIVAGLLLAFCVITINSLPTCPKDACNTVKCVGPNHDDCKKPNQEIIRGGRCNCCFVCYTYLDENETCHFHLLGDTPTSGCKSGLTCRNGKCVKRTRTL
ncbi:hypothetical protein WA026_020049 [Henosepilachna vigintioctopunctata]|uniref:Uncharacterized protein n=1 Tax=Henosepilachna vigintioctopunctata TaxID=420089 RepID=A0AAW1UEV7_9CUCU